VTFSLGEHVRFWHICVRFFNIPIDRLTAHPDLLGDLAVADLRRLFFDQRDEPFAILGEDAEIAKINAVQISFGGHKPEFLPALLFKHAFELRQLALEDVARDVEPLTDRAGRLPQIVRMISMTSIDSTSGMILVSPGVDVLGGDLGANRG
jgi:hypothetical protein